MDEGTLCLVSFCLQAQSLIAVLVTVCR